MISKKTAMIKNLLKDLSDRTDDYLYEQIKSMPLTDKKRQSEWDNAVHAAICKVQDDEVPYPRYMAFSHCLWRLHNNGFDYDDMMQALHKLFDECSYLDAEHASQRKNLISDASTLSRKGDL